MDNVKGSKEPNVGGRGTAGNEVGGGREGCEDFELSNKFGLVFGELRLRDDDDDDDECSGGGGGGEDNEFLFKRLDDDDEWWWCNDRWGERERERFDDE